MREIRRRTRGAGAFPDGQSASNLAAARLRHIAGTKWAQMRKAFANYRFSGNDAVPATIAAEMGHADVAMTLNTYSQKVKHLGISWAEIKFPLMRPSGPNVVDFKNRAS